MVFGRQWTAYIAAGVSTPSGYRLLSWFGVITDPLFAEYSARGVAARSDAVISRAARDADSLACSGETFTTAGTLPAWVVLN